MAGCGYTAEGPSDPVKFAYAECPGCGCRIHPAVDERWWRSDRSDPLALLLGFGVTSR